MMELFNKHGGDARSERDKIFESMYYHHHWWHRRAFAAICQLKMGERMTGEEIRLKIEPGTGVAPDQHHWGAMICKAVEIKLICPTGVRRPMQTKKSHARKTDEYVILGRR